jgi:hypothetical protein
VRTPLVLARCSTASSNGVSASRWDSLSGTNRHTAVESQQPASIEHRHRARRQKPLGGDTAQSSFPKIELLLAFSAQMRYYNGMTWFVIYEYRRTRKQRETANTTAVFSRPIKRAVQDLCGKDDIDR